MPNIVWKPIVIGVIYSSFLSVLERSPKESRLCLSRDLQLSQRHLHEAQCCRCGRNRSLHEGQAKLLLKRFSFACTCYFTSHCRSVGLIVSLSVSTLIFFAKLSEIFASAQQQLLIWPCTWPFSWIGSEPIFPLVSGMDYSRLSGDSGDAKLKQKVALQTQVFFIHVDELL